MRVHIQLQRNVGGVKLLIDAQSYDKNYDRPLELDKLCVSAKIITSKDPEIMRMGVRLLLILTNRYYKESNYYKYDPCVYEHGKCAYFQGFWQSDNILQSIRVKL